MALRKLTLATAALLALAATGCYGSDSVDPIVGGVSTTTTTTPPTTTTTTPPTTTTTTPPTTTTTTPPTTTTTTPPTTTTTTPPTTTTTTPPTTTTTTPPTTTTTTPPTTTAPPASIMLDARVVEDHIFTLTNQHRVDNGLPRLERNSEIDAIAQAHAQDMGIRDYYSHTTPEGLQARHRARNAGYQWTWGYTENIHRRHTARTEFELAQSIVSGGINTPDTEENILNGGSSRMGVGVHIPENGPVLVVINFSGPVKLDTRVIEDHIFTLTNQHRVYNGLSKLERSSEIDAIALAHAQDMGTRNYYSHTTPEGLNPWERARDAGYQRTWNYLENIHKANPVSTELELAQNMVTAWMENPSYRKNILYDSYNRIGIGVHLAGDGAILGVQNFSGFINLDARIAEDHILTLTNQFRVDNGLPGLERNSEIDAIALAHAQDMGTRNYYSHTTPEGLRPWERARNASYEWAWWFGENIHQVYPESTELELAQHLVTDWIDSPGHRAAILNDTFSRIGIGVYIAENGAIFGVQNFSGPSVHVLRSLGAIP